MFLNGNFKTQDELAEEVIDNRIITFYQAKYARKFYNAQVKKKSPNAVLKFNRIIVPENEMKHIIFSKRAKKRIESNKNTKEYYGKTTETAVEV